MEKRNQKNRAHFRIFHWSCILLLAIIFIAVYTYILQTNYSEKTLQATEKHNVELSDAIYQMVSNAFTDEDYADINTTQDMQTERYQILQQRLNEIRSMRDVRYLYTAKKTEDGTWVYLIDGLDLDAEDFAYPGMPIEEEVVPYLEKAMAGEKIYSQEIMDTTWGHIFTACYPIYSQSNKNEIIGVLSMELDMESTYQAIAENNLKATRVAVAAGILAVALIVCGFCAMRSRQNKDRIQKEMLEAAVDKADAANKAKSTFLFNMSHDIRTPMNAILGYSDLARKHLNDPDKLETYMNNIHISGERLLSIINNVLEFARIENNDAIIEESVVRAGEGFDSCVVMMKTEAQKKNQELKVTKKILYPYIYADVPHMAEVVLNIMSNAVKYTGDGGTIQCALNQYPGEKDGWCITEIIVEDNGIGMSEEFQKRIFDTFSRERSSTVSGVDGTGLGMGIVKKLVDLLDGTIRVESKLGEGSKFTVRVPGRIATEAQAKQRKAEYHLAGDDVKGKRILLAEDNDLNAEIAMELLAMEGLVVERAKDGVDCVEMLEKAREDYYDLILMDIQMPVMNGYKATKIIREMEDKKKSEIPIVAMTANAFVEDRQKALEVGMNEHVAKPIDMNALMKVFERLLGVKIVNSKEESK